MAWNAYTCSYRNIPLFEHRVGREKITLLPSSWLLNYEVAKEFGICDSSLAKYFSLPSVLTARNLVAGNHQYDLEFHIYDIRKVASELLVKQIASAQVIGRLSGTVQIHGGYDSRYDLDRTKLHNTEIDLANTNASANAVLAQDGVALAKAIRGFNRKLGPVGFLDIDYDERCNIAERLEPVLATLPELSFPFTHASTYQRIPIALRQEVFSTRQQSNLYTFQIIYWRTGVDVMPELRRNLLTLLTQRASTSR